MPDRGCRGAPVHGLRLPTRQAVFDSAESERHCENVEIRSRGACLIDAGRMSLAR